MQLIETKFAKSSWQLGLLTRVFGSVIHGSDSDESDLDILVDPTPDTTLFDLGAIRFKLRNLLGVHVDVLTPDVLPKKFRDTVIAEARPV